MSKCWESFKNIPSKKNPQLFLDFIVFPDRPSTPRRETRQPRTATSTQTSEIRNRCSSIVRKSTSRCVTSPTSFPPIAPVSVTGIPENPNEVFAPATSATVCAGDITSGLTIKPCLYFCRIPGRIPAMEKMPAVTM